MKHLRNVLPVIAIALAVLLFTPAAHAADKTKVAVVISTLNNPWFVVLADTAKARATELGYDAVIFDSQNDTAKEAAHFENLIAAGYKAVLFNPTDANGSVANVRKAKEAGIPVFCIDREINATNAATSQMLSDSYSGCVALGQYFVKTVGTKGEYAELLGLVGDNNTWNRSKGFHSVVDRYPDLKMVAQQSADFDRAKGLAVFEAILQKNPNLKAVFCGNDAMAMGAYQALVSAGKEDQVKVFGFDGADDVVKLIAEGKIAATGMQFPKLMAQKAAEFADEYLKGKRDFQQKIPVKVDLVTSANVSKYGDYGKEMMRRAVPIILLIVIAGGIIWFFPLFRVVPLKQAIEKKAAATFSPRDFVDQFWTEKLLLALDKAVPVEKLLTAIQTDAATARKQYSRSVGLSESYTYFVSGSGKVLAASDEEVALSTTGSSTTNIVIPVGMLFGNAIRDGTGLLSVNDYPNSQDFNTIAAELNQKVETEVLPKLRQQAKVGATIEFVGCAEINDESSDLQPLRVVPVHVIIK